MPIRPTTWGLDESLSQWRRFGTARFYGPINEGTLTTGTPAVTVMQCAPFLVGQRFQFAGIGIEVTAFIASGLARLGIYYDRGDCFPGTLLRDYGTVATTTSNNFKSIVQTQTLEPGLYWLAHCAQTAAATIRIVNGGAGWTGVSTGTNQGTVGFQQTAAVAAGLPATWGASTDVVNAPRVMLAT